MVFNHLVTSSDIIFKLTSVHIEPEPTPGTIALLKQQRDSERQKKLEERMIAVVGSPPIPPMTGATEQRPLSSKGDSDEAIVDMKKTSKKGKGGSAGRQGKGGGAKTKGGATETEHNPEEKPRRLRGRPRKEIKEK